MGWNTEHGNTCPNDNYQCECGLHDHLLQITTLQEILRLISNKHTAVCLYCKSIIPLIWSGKIFFGQCSYHQSTINPNPRITHD